MRGFADYMRTDLLKQGHDATVPTGTETKKHSSLAEIPNLSRTVET